MATIARKGSIRAGQRRATPRQAARQPIGRHRRARRGIDTGRAAPRRQRRPFRVSAASAQRAAGRRGPLDLPERAAPAAVRYPARNPIGVKGRFVPACADGVCADERG